MIERAVPGSYLALVHVTSKGASPQLLERIDETYRDAPAPLWLRSESEILSMFNGAELVEPVLQAVQDWFPGQNVPAGNVTLLAGLARLWSFCHRA
jgi:hypothetical protein